MIQLVMASTLFSAMTAAAALDEGLLGAPDVERVLVVSNNAAIPEVVQSLSAIPGAAAVLARFDRIVDLNETLVHAHPSSWRPLNDDLEMHQRHFRAVWGLGDSTIQLVAESLHVPPAASLARIFGDSELVVLSEGLMSFGPTRTRQSPAVGRRISELVYLDLIPGLRPLLFEEVDVPTTVVALPAFRRVVDDMLEECGPLIDAVIAPSPKPTGLVLGQYLATLGLWTAEEEELAHVEMLRTAYDRGALRIVFKPHPAASPALLTSYREAVEGWGAEFIAWEDGMPAEVVLARVPAVILVASFSTALVTGRALFDVPIESWGTQALLGSLTPYQNSNRIPVTIIDAVTQRGDRYQDVAALQRLVVAVAYAMQANNLDHRRDEAIATLEEMSAAERMRYFYRRRLTALNLPGRFLPSRAAREARRLSRSLPRKWRRLLGG
ncbi:polysialyltransferase family glycosyltransferase [Demequina aurantiaca]|uniref:polysialyltransferase family glycosyltransferase n=1 Tax=Demequina aurantiaca TaxID=676200 RepID=UPI003D350E25